ncbi:MULTISPECIES: hypothetical protein [Kocuria]|uniref:hypothetical protein n=1 Tax=Kocuria TaxID=57493 RepID=UPI00065F7ECB|nr:MULTISPECIES: hypothetical protein [Kocuria]RUQ23235.1 hypothetical protein D8M21_00485 [Kocuria sp. HSID16901]
MAENLRDVPAKFGHQQRGFYPRINSYGRRIMAVLPTIALALALLAILYFKRPAAAFVVVVLAAEVIAALMVYSLLKPAVAVLTDTHVLRGRLIGWKAVRRDKIHHTVFVERLQPKAALTAGDGPLAKLRYRGMPGLWFTDESGKRVLRFDGRVWDAKTLRELSTLVTPETTRYSTINVTELAERQKGLVSWSELHPTFRSTAVVLLGLAFLALIVVLGVWPEVFGAREGIAQLGE